MSISTPTSSQPKKSNRTLITCGIIAAILLCLGSIAVIAVMVAAGGLGGGTLAVEITAPPPVVQGKQFQIKVNLKNTSDSALTVKEIRLPGVLTNAASLINSTPDYASTADYNQQTGYKFDLKVDAGKTETVVFTFKAIQEGDFTGDVEVKTGKTQTAALRVVITAAAANEPSNVAKPTLSPTSAPSTLGKIPFQAVVQIIAIVDVQGKTQPGWTGSGSIISSDGLILTNAHVVLSDRFYEVKELQVALTTAADQPPQPEFIMELLQADAAMDIAVGRIKSDLDGNPVDFGKLKLPTVPIGNSDAMNLGDPLVIIGYPGIGGETITLTRGEVSGFTSGQDYGNRAFIKTSATIAGGNSGGLAANDKGEIIGVPTQLGYGGEGQYIDCRVLADTNRDGIIDDKDTCIPTGGFINALRPIKLAEPYIDAAKRGEVNIKTAVDGPSAEMPQESSLIYSDDFSDPSSGWIDDQSENGSARYNNGEYLINVQTSNYMIWSPLDQILDDTIIQVDTRVVKATGEGDYGILCRYQDDNNFYTIEISEDGYYSIWKYENGDFTSLVDWKNFDVVAPGEPALLTAGCIGNTLIVAINDTVLDSVTDDAFSSGKIGLIAGTFDKPDVTIAFDNFSVYKP